MRLILLTSILTLLMAATAPAFAPQGMTFQGRLTDADGMAVPDGVHSVTFRIYTQLVGGAPIWNSTREVTISGGVFAVILGEEAPLDLTFDQGYYVSVQYEAEPQMVPRVPLLSSPYALNVADGAAVTSLNGLTADVNLIAGSNVTINPAGDDLVISATGAVSDNDWTVNGNDMHSTPAGNVGIGVDPPGSKLQVNGDITAGTGTAPGYFVAYGSGGATSSFGGNYSGEGSELDLREENGASHTFIQPDSDGRGGFLQVYNGNGAAALQVNGNTGASGAPRISMYGNSSVFFNLEETADAAVVLPLSAVSSGEISNEPGLASQSDHGGASYALQTSLSTITARTIVVPTAGYILATSSLEVELNHQGTLCYTSVGLSMSANSLPINQDLNFLLPNGAAQGEYLNPIAPTAVFEVSAGSHTVYLLGQRAGTTDAVAWDAQLNLLFVPTAYGTVALAEGNDDGRQGENDRQSRAMTSSDLAAELRQSQRDNQDRLERELADLQAQIAALTAEVSSLNGNSEGSNSR